MRALPRLFALSAAAVLTCTLASCKREQPAPAKPAVPAPAAVAKAPTKEQAMVSLMEVPELKSWSEQLEKNSRGKVHGAIIEDDPQPRIINGKPYWQLSFVENRPDMVHRRASFLVAQSGGEVLVEDPLSDRLLTLTEWRRTVRKVLANTSE
ncbi:hypothetical protein NX774_06510 [Massilia agilis]|uniref:Lipoprotein n=1 Tax=Massilia agilis TaxID=1811226 RepID=A0ABT2D8F0_9BURK|nr:hypothetical protein [Massilia agilis]MCS0807575.1 hypothetical protein [Massilia agilis]